MSNYETKMIPLKELSTEAGSEELVKSESMKPYLEVLKAEMSGHDTTSALAALKYSHLSKDMFGGWSRLSNGVSAIWPPTAWLRMSLPSQRWS